MRRFLLKSALGLGCCVAFFIAWVCGARHLSLVLDRLHTVVLEAHPIAQLGIEEAERGMLRINDLPLSTARPDYSPYPMKMKVDPAGSFVVESGNHAIALGRVDDSLGGSRAAALKPELADKARLRIERSMLSWPTPFDFNFMTGHSPSWKRHLYYRLVWRKPDGGRLEMLWRYEQYYYDDWASGFMTREGTTGLIRVDIWP